MKYAIVSLGGALGMGLSVIADSMVGHSEAETYAGIGCGVMIIGVLGVIFSNSKKDDA
jgi:hypothetical protein